MLHIGYHESSSDGYLAMGKEALSVNADTFAFFTRNPRGGQAKPLDMADVAAFNTFAAEHQFAPLVAHAPYTLNPCALDPGLRDFARNTMIDDMKRLAATPGNLYNFHPGSHVKQGAEVGIALTSQHLAAVFGAFGGTLPGNTTILIETMAGKGSEIGRTFEEVRAIIDQTYDAMKDMSHSLDTQLGVCLDTCHVWDGGYDIVHNLDGVISNFDSVIGLGRLKAIHLNDSMNPFESHKDRHACIGKGSIGAEALIRVINHEALYTLPFILETPNEHDGYKAEIELLRNAFTH